MLEKLKKYTVTSVSDGEKTGLIEFECTIGEYYRVDDVKEMVLKMKENLKPSDNKRSTPLPTFSAFEFFMKVNKDLTNHDIYDYLTGNGEHS